MAVKIKNTPSPDVLMNSMRSIGYNFKTAIADIIDNSISAKAKNIYINSPINDQRIFISILDDGEIICITQQKMKTIVNMEL